MASGKTACRRKKGALRFFAFRRPIRIRSILYRLCSLETSATGSPGYYLASIDPVSVSQEMMNTYNNLVEKCFNECITSFRSKALFG